jgi:ubiquinol-cytochrome c reductase cytochrome b subunit
MNEDKNDKEYQAGLAVSQRRAERAILLADKGIPVGGPLEMLRMDPLTRGPDVYAQHCNKCHVLDGVGERDAPDHTGYGSREWIFGLVHNPDDNHYFGKTKLDDMKPMGKLGDEKLHAVTEFLFSLGHEANDPPFDKALADRGKQVFKDTCMDCHLYEGDGANLFEGPDMTGYGSRAWIFRQVKDAGAETQYGELNKMPKFADDLDDHDIKMVTAFLRQQRFAHPDFKPEPAKPTPDDDKAADDK